MEDPTEYPLVSVVVVNFNGGQFVENCIRSILSCDYPSLEVLFVDNDSTDNSLRIIREKFPGDLRLRIIENRSNAGPVKARNIAVQSAGGEYIAFLDNDTEVQRNWLRELVILFNGDHSIGAGQCKLLLFDKKTIDTCGHYMSITGFPYEVGVNEKDCGQYDSQFSVFGARSAAMMIRRKLFSRIGLFDEDYFIYAEETDLCWRVWLAGSKIVFVPHSVVYHRRGGTLNRYSQFRVFFEGSKNGLKNILKDAGFPLCVMFVPLFVSVWFMIGIASILRNEPFKMKNILVGFLWNIKNIKRTMRERRYIQKKVRKVSDWELRKVMFGPLGFRRMLQKGFSWVGRI